MFITKNHREFNAQAFDISHEFPKLPQSLDLVNQTVSIPTEPVVEHYTYKNMLEFTPMDAEMQEEFNRAIQQYDEMVARQEKEAHDLRIEEPEVVTTAVATVDKKMARGSEMMMTTMLSQSDGGSDVTSNFSMNRRATRLSTKHNFEMAKKQAAEKAKTATQEPAEVELQFDPHSGMQIMKVDMELTFQQKLQMRIAKERAINIDRLRGDQFEVLKKYKKLKECEELVNNMADLSSNPSLVHETPIMGRGG